MCIAGRMRAAFLTQSDDSVEVASELEDPVETRLLAMERISFIFERFDSSLHDS